MDAHELWHQLRDQFPEEVVVSLIATIKQCWDPFVAVFRHDPLDHDACQSAAHQLKGSCPSLGFEELGQVAAELETACKTQSDDIAVIALRLVTELEALMQAMPSIDEII